MKPIAIVIPWFGRGLTGGAETQAWQIASRLVVRGHAVDVLTTCCRSVNDDWTTNHLPAGVTREAEGFSIRRFPVQRRRRRVYNRVSRCLDRAAKVGIKSGVPVVSPADAAAFARESIKSVGLLEYLRENAGSYHAFIFMPYLYGPVLNGLPLVAARAWLQPCLHDEPFAYLSPVAGIFQQARGIFFNSEGEQELAVKLFGPGIIPKSVVVGEGVEVPDIAEAATPEAKKFPFGDDPYVLALGRKEEGKNTLLLLAAFRLFKARHPDSRLRLVFAGVGAISTEGLEGQVFDLGVVSEADKLALLSHCRALLQPSGNESFSRVIMEAWRRGRPVAAHRDCLATATAVRRCSGGWLAADEREWSDLLARIERASDAELAAKGAAGLEYAREAADWQRTMECYERALFGAMDACSCGDTVRAPCVNPARWPTSWDTDLADALQGGQTNLLFVGRLEPRNGQEELIRCFHRYLEIAPDAVLHLVDAADKCSLYGSALEDYATALNIRDKVNVAVGATERQLATYYRFAHLFWSMSEADGFCAPLIEAMWFDLPILAFKSPGVSETLGEAALMFTTQEEPAHLVELARLLVCDPVLRRKLIGAQRRRRARFLPPAVRS